MKKIVYMALDFGGSGLKVVCSYNEEIFAFVVMPQVADTEVKKTYPDREFAIDITKNLWVEANDKVFALGQLAANTYMQPIPLKEPKKTYMLPRALGAIAVAAERFKLKNFKVSMQVLLPAAEFDRDDKLELCQGLREASRDFDSPIGRISCEIIKPFTAKPEGFGMQRRKMIIEGEKSQVGSFVVVMLGHRNTSLYLSSGGEQSHYMSNDMGFVKAIKHSNVSQVKAIINPKLVDRESVDVYWAATAAWLRENWPDNATDAIIGGGPMAVVGDRANDFIDKLLENNRSVSRTKTMANGGMPITPYQESQWKSRSNVHDLLASWPENIGIAQSQRQQFVDVYCLLVTQLIANDRAKK